MRMCRPRTPAGAEGERQVNARQRRKQRRERDREPMSILTLDEAMAEADRINDDYDENLYRRAHDGLPSPQWMKRNEQATGTGRDDR